jgi:hypothetical protein
VYKKFHPVALKFDNRLHIIPYFLLLLKKLNLVKFTGIISVILLPVYSASTLAGSGMARCCRTHSQRPVITPVQPLRRGCDSSKSDLRTPD